MNTKATALTILLALTLSSIGTPFLPWTVSAVDETIYPWDMVFKALPIITVNSPPNDTTIFANYVPLNFTITKLHDWLVQLEPQYNLQKSGN